MSRDKARDTVVEIARDLSRHLLRLLSVLLIPAILLLVWVQFGNSIVVHLGAEITKVGWPQAVFSTVLAYLSLRMVFALLRHTVRQTHRSVSVRSGAYLSDRSAVLDAIEQRHLAKDPTEQRRARHEAAHALMIWLRGARVVSLDLSYSGDHGGRCAWEIDPATTTVVEMAWTELLCSVAGNEVDLRAGHRDQGSRDDLQSALAAASAIISTDTLPQGVQAQLSTDSLLSVARTQVRTLLDEHEGMITAIAQRLQQAPGQVWVRPDLDVLAREMGGSSSQ